MPIDPIGPGLHRDAGGGQVSQNSLGGRVAPVAMNFDVTRRTAASDHVFRRLAAPTAVNDAAERSFGKLWLAVCLQEFFNYLRNLLAVDGDDCDGAAAGRREDGGGC